MANSSRRLLVWIWMCMLASGDVYAQRGLLHECRLPGKSASYLLGTMHSDDPRVLQLADVVAPYFGSVDSLALELVPDGQAALATLVAMRLPAEATLSQLVDERLYRATVEAMATRGIPSAIVDRTKPWALALQLSLPTDTGVYLDLRLYLRAQERNLATLGLETVDEQLKMFDLLSEAQQAEFLAYAVKNLERMPLQFEAMVQTYLEGDLAALKAFADSAMSELDMEMAAWFDRALITERNQRMAERSWPLIEQGGVMVAVGALHLEGETGLLAEFRRRGCNLRKLH